MNTNEKKSTSANPVPLLDIKKLFVRFLPHSPDLSDKDWFKELQAKYDKYDKDYDDLTEEEQEEVQLAYHLRGCLCWRLDYTLNGKKEQVGQVYYLDFDEEKDWQSKLKFGTYYLCGDEGISFKEA